jgi:phage shock protein A
MSRNNRKSREQLKEEYKQHFRKMQDAKEQYRRTRKSRNIIDALKDMDSTDLMESFDSFLFGVQDKVARVEARLDIALESIESDAAPYSEKPELDETGKHAKAKETLQQVKNDMGLLYNELEKQAKQIDVDKTVGTKNDSKQLKDKP